MRFEKEYRERCSARGLDAAAEAAALDAVAELESAAAAAGYSLELAPLAVVEAQVAALVKRGTVNEEDLMAMARYFAVAGVDAVAIRLLAYILPIEVLPKLSDRLERLEGAAVRDRVLSAVGVPAPGSPPESYPQAAAAFTRALESELGREKAGRVLCCNVHGVPAAAFAKEREAYLAAPSLDAWLQDYHERQTAVLAKHADDGTLWFEQKITPRVVDFVRANQEIMSGVRDGDRIFHTKIPYNPDGWLSETDPIARRRLACHCPLAASSITAEGAGVPALWCWCSAGFDKFLFDVVFGTDTECEVLESVLAGDDRCRFAISIPASAQKPSASGQ